MPSCICLMIAASRQTPLIAASPRQFRFRFTLAFAASRCKYFFQRLHFSSPRLSSFAFRDAERLSIPRHHIIHFQPAMPRLPLFID